jgi:hypothetical protein
MAEAEAQQTEEPSWMGCLIPIVAAVVFLGLGTCAVVTGLTQNRMIGGFTEDEPREIPTLQPSAGQIAEVEAKLKRLAEAAQAKISITERFTAEDLNVLIATQPVLEGFRGNTRVRTVSRAVIEAEVSQPMRKLGKGQRYLNGFFYFAPARSETNQWQLMLQDIHVPERSIPEGFLGMFRELHMFRISLDQEALQEVLTQIRYVQLEENHLVIVTWEGEPE